MKKETIFYMHHEFVVGSMVFQTPIPKARTMIIQSAYWYAPKLNHCMGHYLIIPN